MRVLLVANVENLADKLNALNPELEYCGIVVDEVEAAKKTLADRGLSQVPLYPLNELKTCVESLDYNYILCVQDRPYGVEIVNKLYTYNVPTEKLISFASLHTRVNWETERLLRYYRGHLQDFEMFATGINTTEAEIDIRQFKHKAINFATSSQDLYYNFQIAKAVILYGGGIVRYVMLSSGSRLILSTLTFQRTFHLRLVYYLILSPLTIYIISQYLSTLIKNFFVRNG